CLTVNKSANGQFTRTFVWNVTKDATPPTAIVPNGGDPANFDYTVKVTHDAGTDSGWMISGQINASSAGENCTPVSGPFTVTDVVDNGGTCVVANGGLIQVLPGSASYTCTYAAAPNPFSAVNTATVTGGSGSTTYSRAVNNYDLTSPNASVTVNDNV